MCFVLYAGTSKPMQPKPWCEQAPDISVETLTEREKPIAAHFSSPNVQYIGSTSGCGCDFPHLTFHNGDWPSFDNHEQDPEREATDRRNREALVNLLHATCEQTVELYGVWDGDFAVPPAVREKISISTILDSNFWFKERGFYAVDLF